MAKERLTKAELQEKRDYAKLLFIREKLTQKEIAFKIGISQNTISKWASEDNWEGSKKSTMLTREEQIRNMLNELEQINSEIANSDRKYATKEQAYIRDTLVQNLEKLEKEVSADEAYNVLDAVLKFWRKIDIEKAKQLFEDFDPYIKSILK